MEDPAYGRPCVSVYFWGAAVILSVLFVLAWYLRCGGVNSFGFKLDCF